MTASVIFVVGLPGSGKTEFIRSMAHPKTEFDDYKAGAFNDDSAFTSARRYLELITTLREGRECVISDIDFCRSEARAEAECILRREVPGLHLQWICFENDPAQCVRNARARAESTRRNLEAELDNIRRYASQYVIPPHAQIFRVWRNGGEER